MQPYSNDSLKYKVKFQSSNIPTDPHADRTMLMQTVTMVKENMLLNSGNENYGSGLEVQKLRNAMAKSNFRMGSTLPEHNHIDMKAFQKSPLPTL